MFKSARVRQLEAEIAELKGELKNNRLHEERMERSRRSRDAAAAMELQAAHEKNKRLSAQCAALLRDIPPGLAASGETLYPFVITFVPYFDGRARTAERRGQAYRVTGRPHEMELSEVPEAYMRRSGMVFSIVLHGTCRDAIEARAERLRQGVADVLGAGTVYASVRAYQYDKEGAEENE